MSVPFEEYARGEYGGEEMGGKYRTKLAKDLKKAKEAFVKSLVKKGYSERSAKMLFGKEEKVKKIMKNTKKYKGPAKKTAKKGRKVSAYNKFVSKAMKQGHSMKEAAKMWNASK